MDEILDGILDQEFLADSDFRNEVVAKQGWFTFQPRDQVTLIGKPGKGEFEVVLANLVVPQGFGPKHHHQALLLKSLKEHTGQFRISGAKVQFAFRPKSSYTFSEIRDAAKTDRLFWDKDFTKPVKLSRYSDDSTLMFFTQDNQEQPETHPEMNDYCYMDENEAPDYAGVFHIKDN